MWLAAAVFALVTQDPTALRSAPSARAPKSALLWQGDVLEVRGARAGYLQVWDHRRERSGYVLDSSVRTYDLETARSAAVLETVRFLRDVPGLEALGIGHAALYLKLAPPDEIGSEVFDAIGTMAERLARRASSRVARPQDAALAGQLDVVRGYGVGLESVETGDQTLTCYDGEAFRRVLAADAADEALRAAFSQAPPAPLVPARLAPVLFPPPGAVKSVDAAALARASLGLTRPGCTVGTPNEQWAAREQGSEALGRVPVDGLPSLVRHRVRLRRASVYASLAHDRARRGDAAGAEAAARRALDELALVPRAELAESDADAVDEAFLRVSVVRPLLDPSSPSMWGLTVRLAPRAAGETCLTLVEDKGGAALAEHCTYAVVWPKSVRVAPQGAAVSVALSPLDGWLSLLVLRPVDGRWAAQLVSAGTEVGLGYVEWAGWTPDGKGLLVAREARGSERTVRSFELVELASLTVTRKAGRPSDLTPFHRWSAPEWRERTLALR